MVGEPSYVLAPAAQDGWFPLASSFVFLRKGRGILPYYSKSLSPQKSTKESRAELIPSWSVTVVVPNLSLKGLKIFFVFVCLFLKGDTFCSINVWKYQERKREKLLDFSGRVLFFFLN